MSLVWKYHLEDGRRLLLNLISQVMNFESIQPWNKLVGGTFGPIFWVHHEQHVGKPSPEVRPVGVVVSDKKGRKTISHLLADIVLTVKTVRPPVQKLV